MFDASARDFYNHIEPYIWYFVAILIVPALRAHAPLRPRLMLGVVIAIFGTSDFFETEAWWTPWWLFLWKAVSLGLMAAIGLYIRRQSRNRNVAKPMANDGVK
ncbi:MAG: hypothetical protein HZA51_08485 [Planctomycetes bacterium]|nr:hypothetical protein [Planctomycetota bacterium]